MSEANGQLPLGWAATALGEIVEPRAGKADPQATPSAHFIGMEQVESRTMRLLGTVSASTMKSGANVFKPFDVLYGRMRAYLNKVYQPDFGGLCSGEFIVLPETSAVLGRFLKYRLNSDDFVRFANHLNTGDRPRVDFDQIAVFSVLLPPKPEQERIADTLDELLSDLDAGVAALKRVQAKLKQYRGAVLKAAVEGALTADWRAQHLDSEPAATFLQRILDERRRRWQEAQLEKFKATGKEPPTGWKVKYQEPAAPDTANGAALPEGWSWTTVDQLSLFVTSGSRGWAEYYSEEGALFVRSQDIRSDRLLLNDVARVTLPQPSEGTRTRLHRGDFLVTITGANVAKAALVDCNLDEAYISQHVGMVRLLDERLGRFIHIYATAPSGGRKVLLKMAYGAGKPGLNLDNLRHLPIPVPPLVEQLAIVDAVDDQISVIEHLEGDLETKLKSSQALRQSILRQAFSGQLVSQDPTDEPASELLKRIAAEREERTRLVVAARQVIKGKKAAKPK